jgi:hypothetical protein
MRSARFKEEEESFVEDKPRRKPRCNKKRSKLAESYPSYLQVRCLNLIGHGNIAH